MRGEVVLWVVLVFVCMFERAFSVSVWMGVECVGVILMGISGDGLGLVSM